MMEIRNHNVVLYAHGMGGGGDSRIPGILREWFHANAGELDLEVVVRTYDFDPVKAQKQLCAWVDDIKPVMVIGESLGACHAILAARRAACPCLFVSPSLNAPLYLGGLCWLSLIPGVSAMLRYIYKPRPGDRQQMDFKFSSLKNYLKLRKSAMAAVTEAGPSARWHAFFGTHDHYYKSGIVSIRTWVKHFPQDTYTMYEGTHFMEEEYIYSLLIPEICSTLLNNSTTKR